jgi:hypothetical protein
MLKMTLAIFTILALLCTSAAAQHDCVSIAHNGNSLAEKQFNHSPTPLLSVFNFRLSQSDNNIKGIVIWPDLQASTILLNFFDKSAGHDYCFDVDHFDITDRRIQSAAKVDYCVDGQCTVPLNKPDGDFVFVLTGFRLNFEQDDHYIKDIAIHEDNGQLTVAYNDRHVDAPNDTFSWGVQYAYVPGMFLAKLIR